ncbi:MAG: DNA gyrase subunit A [bacterium]|nr:DNA gyrase subunit A [bacterium]
MANSKKTAPTPIGKVIPREITQEMKQAYLDYAMSVIVARALPDVRDGLKPVHRRILYAMKELGLSYKSSYKKSARIVGEVLGKYHPHGDQSVYMALVRMAQDFSMRYPLVDGQGNFGSIDGDSPAAMRYTEARLAKIAEEMLADIDKDTVDFVDNFDASYKEPTVLPAKTPNLLLNGSEGIAVGMATKIPPHNLTEVVDALIHIITKAVVTTQPDYPHQPPEDLKGYLEDISEHARVDYRFFLNRRISAEVFLDELLEFIKGPDFPTGAHIFDQEQIRLAYSTGRGQIPIRSQTVIETASNRPKIIITEIPYQVNKASTISKIAHLVRSKAIDGISEIRDESDRQGLRIVIECRKNSRPKVILNQLFKHTQLQTSFPVNLVALVHGIPQTLTLKEILLHFLNHRLHIVTRRQVFLLNQNKSRAHILAGLKKALDHLDEVIKTIRSSKDADLAKTNLMTKFGFSATQAQAILDMQLRRLAALERQKIEDEYNQVMSTIKALTLDLIQPEHLTKIIKQELAEIKKAYGDPRRTKVHPQSLKNFSEEDLVPSEDNVILMTKDGYIKRLPFGTYRIQRRGGKGTSGLKKKQEDEVAFIFIANTHDKILFFTDKGRVFALKCWEIPETSRQAKGTAVINLINIYPDEKVKAVLSIKKTHSKDHIALITKKGIIKKTALDKFRNIRSNGIIAIRLDSDDELIDAQLTSGQDHVMVISAKGKGIRFDEAQVKSTGRASRGVKAIHLKPGDYVVSFEVLPPEHPKPADKRKKSFRDLLVISKSGIGKRTPLKYFHVQKRGGIGIKVMKTTPKTGHIADTRIVTQNDQYLMITSKKGQIIKLPIKNIPQLTRDTQGVILMRFSEKSDQVADIAIIKKEEEEPNNKPPAKSSKKH